MHPRGIQQVFGLLLIVFSFTMLPPAAVSLFYADGAASAFTVGFALTLATGLALWLPVRKGLVDLGVRDGFLIVALFWVVLGLFGALPLLVSHAPLLTVTDAVFESLSGLTTTGATILTDIDQLPPGILFYRQQLQWLGGMGIIVLAVAVLPMLGIGGMQLYRAEIAGPLKNARLTARITETAKALWYIYLGLTVVCAIAYAVAGMSLFDAISHAFSTVAIGGFSTHDASIGYFQSAAIEAVAVVFMVLAGVNFALHFNALQQLSLRPYSRDAEFVAYLFILVVVSLTCVLALWVTGAAGNPQEAVRQGVFQAVSIGTTTGFTTAPFFAWPGALPILLLLTSFIGACAGSTGGGIKVIRALMLYRQGLREVLQLIHPHALISVKVGREALPNRVIESVWGFFAVYVVTFTAMYLAMAAFEGDLVTAFSAVAACMNNLGPGLGEVGSNFASISTPGKWVLCFAMLLGRLEVFTLLVLLSPAFWRS
ncbi:MAG: TrkH family potassium uptake protein [Pseudomonadota bacterium]|nr:TrkH family potassium uptake protein [Pseudomonadota bacterium]